jgi:hypothetical protein
LRVVAHYAKENPTAAEPLQFPDEMPVYSRVRG